MSLVQKIAKFTGNNDHSGGTEFMLKKPFSIRIIHLLPPKFEYPPVVYAESDDPGFERSINCPYSHNLKNSNEPISLDYPIGECIKMQKLANIFYFGEEFKWMVHVTNESHQVVHKVGIQVIMFQTGTSIVDALTIKDTLNDPIEKLEENESFNFKIEQAIRSFKEELSIRFSLSFTLNAKEYYYRRTYKIKCELPLSIRTSIIESTWGTIVILAKIKCLAHHPIYITNVEFIPTEYFILKKSSMDINDDFLDLDFTTNNELQQSSFSSISTSCMFKKSNPYTIDTFSDPGIIGVNKSIDFNNHQSFILDNNFVLHKGLVIECAFTLNILDCEFQSNNMTAILSKYLGNIQIQWKSISSSYGKMKSGWILRPTRINILCQKNFIQESLFSTFILEFRIVNSSPKDILPSISISLQDINSLMLVESTPSIIENSIIVYQDSVSDSIKLKFFAAKSGVFHIGINIKDQQSTLEVNFTNVAIVCIVDNFLDKINNN